jgi:uncharacterized coiled-coil protein SlyX
MTKPILMPINELCDRLTIAELKLERLSAQELDKTLLSKQIAYFWAGVDRNNLQLLELIAQLKTINGQMWDLEYDLRKGLDDSLGLAEIGKRAIEIRNFNRTRVAVKNQIAELVSQPEFFDCKMNHVSG